MSKKKKLKQSRDLTKGSYFFAYQSTAKSQNGDNVDAIRSAAKNLGPKAVIWENMKNNGKLINQ